MSRHIGSDFVLPSRLGRLLASIGSASRGHLGLKSQNRGLRNIVLGARSVRPVGWGPRRPRLTVLAITIEFAR